MESFEKKFSQTKHRSLFNKVQRLIEPCVYVIPTKDQPSTGVSKIGGRPDLPESFVWPKDHSSGEVLSFLLQLNLSECPSISGLPEKGILYFFIGSQDDASSITNSVVYSTEDSSFTASLESYGKEFKECALEFREGVGVVDLGYFSLHEKEFEEMEELLEDHRTDIYELYKSITAAIGNTSKAQILGPCSRPHDPDEIEDNLKLLLLLPSFRDLELCWWDSGELLFHIDSEDLGSGRFDRTLCSVYST
ncbi:DUF1963 domain-containing protein [Pseudobacteriovorax antillogorgiicola]|uniref:Uncharacterized protein YwqG n=1 Tax=Pseudobacteriovorax antillogorgiicola TaxID=1513793 RepID=A0A1Y6BXH2_9BACT|nr:YwqG family protein [Pseudobacteriovorax antillogorgiicola]TCS53697.1 uncharacterized protein YwqG [Pseudobacteriovorax antillogorgiicola]SMF23065.1 Uncharacterized protein YwqG [Pseudobacteriovorax antillogorgiicola]